MSDWGLVQLGKLNPALEKVKVNTKSSVVSLRATELLRSILPRTLDRTFKVNLPDEDSNNTDDSESGSDSDENGNSASDESN
jgi:hypothetical protein